MAGVKMNHGWEDDLTREINKKVSAAIDKVAKSHGGQPVDIVKAELKRVVPIKFTDKAFLNDLATKISTQK